MGAIKFTPQGNYTTQGNYTKRYEGAITPRNKITRGFDRTHKEKKEVATQLQENHRPLKPLLYL